MKTLQKLKKDKKGFTLIEMVIVLVIIAILAAALVPSMIGWIDDANKKSFLTEARSTLTAVQSQIGIAYSKGINVVNQDSLSIKEGEDWDEIAKKANEQDTGATMKAKVKFTIADNKIATFSYDNGKYKTTYTSKTNSWSEPGPSEKTTTKAP